MPIYEYRCSDCGNEQENLIRTESETPVCEKCGSDGLSRKLSVFAVSGISSSQSAAGDCACGNGSDCCGGGHSSGGCGHSGGCGCA